MQSHLYRCIQDAPTVLYHLRDSRIIFAAFFCWNVTECLPKYTTKSKPRHTVCRKLPSSPRRQGKGTLGGNATKKGVILLMADIAFNYFLGEESEQFSFVKVPKLFFTDKRFSKLSYGAKILYGLLLDRMSLSRKNKWIDKNKRVYVIYTIESIREDFNVSKTVAVKFMKELEDFGLIERKKRPNVAAMIYVKNFVLQEETEIEKAPENQGSLKNGLPEVQILEVQKMEVRKTAQNQGSPNSGSPKYRLPEVQKMESNKTNKSKTEIYNILSSSSDPSEQENVKMMIKQYIDYDFEKSEEPMAEKIVECLSQTFLSGYAGQKIDAQFIAAPQIRQKVLQNLTGQSFALILKNIQEIGGSVNGAIYNLQNYVITCFYKIWMSKKKGTHFVNERTYDFEELEKQLLGVK